MEAIAAFLKKLRRKDEMRILFLGLDASGRTTAMYKLKLGEVVTTIPTIGFNVETFQVDGATVTAWDVGGCDKIRPLWRHYYANTQGVVYFVAGNDRDRLDEALTELRTLTREEELADASLIVFATKQDLPDAMSVAEIDAAVERRLGRRVPVFGTSINRDPTGYHEAMSHLVGMIRDHAVGHAAPSAPPTGPSGTGGGAGGGAGGAGDAADAGDGATSGTGPRITHRPLPDREPKAKGRHMIEAGEHAGRPHNEGIAELLGEWLAREDVDDDTFIKQLCDYTLPAWDHYTHLRLAWLHLHRFGRREGMALIFERIRDFIDHSPRTAAGKTFHETMTYFWVNIVHFAMEATVNPTGDFKGLLVSNPQLVDGGLFLDYYKKATIMTPEARANVVLPDKKPMPSIVYGAAGTPSARAAATTAIKAGGVGAGGAEAMGDAESKGGEAGEVAAGRRTIAKLPDDNVALLALFEGAGDAHDGEGDGKGAGGDDDGDGDISRGGEEAEAESKATAAAASAAVPAYLPNWGHETLIRCVWATLAAAGRRKGVDRVFAALQRVEGAGFHYTIAYYWVQMVDMCMRAEGWDGSAPDASAAAADEAAPEPAPPGEPAAPAEEGKAVDATDGATVTDAQRFAAFYARHPDLRDPRLYLRHYTRATILSYKAAREMVLPDLKPLPSVVVPDAGAAGAAGAGASRGSGWSWKLW